MNWYSNADTLTGSSMPCIFAAKVDFPDKSSPVENEYPIKICSAPVQFKETIDTTKNYDVLLGS